MHMKQFSAAALALALTASLTAPAFASERPDGWTPADGARGALLISAHPHAVTEKYRGVVTLNGTEIESVTYSKPIEGSWKTNDVVYAINELPGTPAGYVPMRLLCQATEKGSASSYKEENRSMFYLNGTMIYTNFDDNSIYIRDEDRNEVLQEGYSCYLRGGITYLPAEFLSTLDGITVNSYAEDGKEYFDVTIEIPGTPLQKLVGSIHDALEMSSGSEPAEWFGFMDIDISAFEELSGQIPMMNIRSDSVIIGKYAEGADKEAGKAALKAYQDAQIQSFEQYLAGPLEIAKNGQIVESADGKYVMLIMSADNDRAIQLFQEGIAQVEAGQSGARPR